MMKTTYIYLILVTFFLSACTDDGGNIVDSQNPVNPNPSPEWLVPLNEVKDGGPGKDGIPAIEEPQFDDAVNVIEDFLSDDDLVIGIASGNDAKAYPHKILDWHEIVNDEFNDEYITISYCPLTGTAFGWEGETQGAKSTFGVSGLLYNANLILYDRNTDSNWSQLKMQCINGELISDLPKQFQVIETNWGSWKKLYPATKVLSFDTQFNRTYNVYPYGDYKTNHDYFIFRATPTNPSLQSKERVFTLIAEGVAKVYKFETFKDGKAVKDSFNGKNYLIVGDENLIRAFEIGNDYQNVNFEYKFDRSKVFFEDSDGNQWSPFGKVLDGPAIGTSMGIPTTVVSYWFAIASFYPDPEIFQHKPNF